MRGAIRNCFSGWVPAATGSFLSRRRVIGLVLGSLLIFIAQGNVAFAHEGWFVEKGQHPGEHFPLDWITAVTALGFILFFAWAMSVDRSRWSERLQKLCYKGECFLPRGREWRIVAVLSGVTLIANSVTGVFLAPNLILPGERLVMLGGVAQVIIGLLLVSQISFFVPGLLILVVAVPLAAISFAPALMIDYLFEFVALALAFVLLGLDGGYLDRRLPHWLRQRMSGSAHLPLPLIRIGLGLTLIVLAAHNKLISPDLALTFLDKYDLNFIPYLGFAEFTNLHFVFAAGMAELAIGLFLVLGIGTRFVAATLMMFLLTTLVVLGPLELVGHLPVLGLAAVLLYRGSGGYRLATAPAS